MNKSASQCSVEARYKDVIPFLKKSIHATAAMIILLHDFLTAVLLLLINVVYANLIHHRHRFRNYFKLQCCNGTVLTWNSVQGFPEARRLEFNFSSEADSLCTFRLLICISFSLNLPPRMVLEVYLMNVNHLSTASWNPDIINNKPKLYLGKSCIWGKACLPLCLSEVISQNTKSKAVLFLSLPVQQSAFKCAAMEAAELS